jgi:hypothetical protein
MVSLQDGTVAGLGRCNCRNSCSLMNAPPGYRTLQGLSAPEPRSSGSKCASEGVGCGFSGHRIVWKWLRNNVALCRRRCDERLRCQAPSHGKTAKDRADQSSSSGASTKLLKDVGRLLILAMSCLCQICSKEPMKYRCPSCGIYR